jgi:2-oxoisovalerate dehydrogenase E1 component
MEKIRTDIASNLDLPKLEPSQLIQAYRTMRTARCLDHKELKLKRQNKNFFQISGAGHEAIQVAMGFHLRPSYDWFYLYYRDRALALSLGQTPLDHLLASVAAEADPNSAGRQMPNHWTDFRLNIASPSSATGTQFLHAVGAAESSLRAMGIPEINTEEQGFYEDEIVLVCAGEGATSEGEFWESMNTACNLKLPIVFLIQDNEYAISVPVEVNTAGGSISKLLGSFPNLLIQECDGTDFSESYRVCAEAITYCRERKGPSLIHAHTVRPYSHSDSDDQRTYRSNQEQEEERDNDPILKMKNFLIMANLSNEEDLDAIDAEITKAIDQDADEALTHAQPPADTATRHIYSEDVDPTSSLFDSENFPEYLDDRELTVVDLINACLSDELERNPQMVVFGQDVADASREESLEEVTGKGGVFKVTHGLQSKFGKDRVFNSPLAEANIVGRAIGMAHRGFKPVVEIQFFDYIWPAFMQIRNEAATMRYRSAGMFSAPIVIRVPYGGYLRGGGIYHSQTGETLFTHTPGLRVVLPSNASDANGLLRTAIRCEDPVIFLEHKHLYRQIHNKGRYPGKNFMIPFGKARLIRKGTDITVIACGALVRKSLEAAAIASDHHGIECEVLDLRTLSPLDMDSIASSVQKTHKVLIAHEDSLSWGIGSEIAARIADSLFPWLDGPVKRVASKDTWVAYAPSLENEILPQTSDVLDGILSLQQF